MSLPEPIVVAGSTPLVLVAPHGGRRDDVRRPWGSAPLKVNDLHTVTLTTDLAAATGAAAVINQAIDRNDVDLNRLSAAHEGAPAFLERLADLVGAAVARHGRAVVLTVHGWNVIQPAVDLGVGCARGMPLDAAAAVSPAFGERAVPALIAACAARGIAATLGARYPARGRENLVQLFTPRYRADPRPLVRQLAALGARADAVQLELGVPLRWPGAWRRRLVDACVAALPELLAADGPAAAGPVATAPASRPAPPRRQTLEIAGDGTSVLVARDAGGARLLLFPPDGGLVMVTCERTGDADADAAGGLRVTTGADGAVHVRFAGPMMRFPDTTPFLDLERGLAAAAVVEQAEVAIDFDPVHPEARGDDFGSVRGRAVLDGRPLDLGGHGFAGGGTGPTTWPRVRLALVLANGARLALTVGPDGGPASGFLCRDGRHQAVVGAEVRLGAGDDPFRGLAVDVEVAGGGRMSLTPQAVQRLPVIRGGAPPLRLVYATCRLPAASGLAGWCELGGV